MHIKTTLITFITALAIMTSGCSTTIKMPTGDELERAKSFEASDQGGALYVYRSEADEFKWSLIELDIESSQIDESFDTYGRCFLRIELPPGKYELEAKTPSLMGSNGDAEVVIDEQGVAFVELKMISRFPLPESIELSVMTDEEAIKIINDQNLRAQPIMRASH